MPDTSTPTTPSVSTPDSASSSTHTPTSTTSSDVITTTTATTTPLTSISTSPISVPPSTTSSSSSTITTTPPSSSSESSTVSSTLFSSTSSSTSTLPPQTSSSSSTTSTSTSFFQTTVTTTNAQGSVTTILTTAAASSAPNITHSNSGSSSSSNTGAIAGGTVGGLAALALLGLFLFFCLRRQRRKDDFDGNFDPDRVGHSQGPLDLTASEVEPYTYPHENTQPGQVDMMREAPGAAGVGAVRQYYDTSAGSPDYGGSRSPTDTHTTNSYLSPNAAAVAGAAYAPSSSSHSPPRSAKEREAFSRFNTTASSASGNALAGGSGNDGLHVVNGPEDDGVVVHQDGGRVRIPADDEQVEREIPPTYDSIPSDSRR